MALALLTATFGLALYVPALPSSASQSESVQHQKVGHTVKPIEVRGSAQGEARDVDVHLWYPADAERYLDYPQTWYTSTLSPELEPINSRWLTWKVPSAIAREKAPIDRNGPPFPVIVFSHGSSNDPIDYASTLELIAAQGFIVAAPYHVNNTQDDLRIDYLNAQGIVSPLLTCKDHRPSPCSRPSLPNSMTDRVNDINAVLNALPGWLGDRADISRAGILAHSRGTVSALAAVAGSDQWGFGPLVDTANNLRIKAIVGLAIGAQAVTAGVNLKQVTVPTLLVAGGLDETSPQGISECVIGVAKDQNACTAAGLPPIASTAKALVSIPRAEHRSFDSTYCDEVQAAGASADTNHNGRIDGDRGDATSELSQWTKNSILDRQTLAGILAPTGSSSKSGRATQYCPSATFTTPVDIGPAVNDVLKQVQGADLLACTSADPLTGRCSQYVAQDPSGAETPLPTTGLDTDEVKLGVTELATTFFGTELNRVGNDGPHFTRYLAPKWLEQHEPMVGTEEVFGTTEEVCPPGQQVVCSD